MVEKACRDCRMVTTRSRCPNCGSDRLSKDFTGIMIIMDVEGSQLARLIGVTRPGTYALRVR